eukprot:9604569-Alexandrium_andersonii.AAC.1
MRMDIGAGTTAAQPPPQGWMPASSTQALLQYLVAATPGPKAAPAEPTSQANVAALAQQLAVLLNPVAAQASLAVQAGQAGHDPAGADCPP